MERMRLTAARALPRGGHHNDLELGGRGELEEAIAQQALR
jgi:hypothetical protein